MENQSLKSWQLDESNKKEQTDEQEKYTEARTTRTQARRQEAEAANHAAACLLEVP